MAFGLSNSGNTYYLKPNLMRVIGTQQHGDINVTFFHWNNRYLIKVEAGPYEQTYKIQEFDLSSEEELSRIVSTEFIEECIKLFDQMAGSLQKSIERL